MRILQVISYFTPRKGGDVNVCCNISKQLAMRGHEVTVITTDLEFDNEYAESIRKLGVKVIPFSCVANISMFLMSPSIKNWLKANIYQYNVIHMHNFRSYQNNEVLHYAKKYNVPYVLQAHGSLPYFAKQNLKKLYDFVWGNKILHNASRVIALHKTEADQYKKMGVVEEKIDVISNGIDLSEYERLPERGQFRKRYNIKDNEKIILYLGRIHKSKGIDLLIATFSELVEDIKDSKLVIVGPDGGCLSELRNQAIELGIEDKVLFTGPLFNRDKLTAYADADIFVTLKFSGLPVTFIEACACGIPIITTTDGDDIDWINKNVGFVVEYKVKSISRPIMKILSDDRLRYNFGNNGKRLVRDELNWDKIVTKVEGVYEDCIDI
jgi:glycosyltransferase involved in cell wall biosynthesis